LVNILGFSEEMKIAMGELQSSLDGIPRSTEEKNHLNTILNDDMAVSLKYILESVTRMDAMLKGLLTLSRAGRAKLHITRVDMNRLVSQILEKQTLQIQQHSTEIRKEDLPACSADEKQLYTVLFHMIDNALKYLDLSRPGKIIITGEKQTGHCIYRIEDNGIGIHPENHDKIFGLYQRLKVKKDIPGDGLGLCLVKRILETLNGRIWIESQRGSGSAFLIQTPH